MAFNHQHQQLHHFRGLYLGLLDDLYILAVARSVAVNPFRHAAGDRGFPLGRLTKPMFRIVANLVDQ